MSLSLALPSYPANIHSLLSYIAAPWAALATGRLFDKTYMLHKEFHPTNSFRLRPQWVLIHICATVELPPSDSYTKQSSFQFEYETGVQNFSQMRSKNSTVESCTTIGAIYSIISDRDWAWHRMRSERKKLLRRPRNEWELSRKWSHFPINFHSCHWPEPNLYSCKSLRLVRLELEWMSPVYPPKELAETYKQIIFQNYKIV